VWQKVIILYHKKNEEIAVGLSGVQNLCLFNSDWGGVPEKRVRLLKITFQEKKKQLEAFMQYCT
jgi:hypothetical protein